MRGFLLSSALVFVAACGGGSHGESICSTTVPPPAACMTTCDPTPGATNACPEGYHCTPDGKCDALCLPGGDQCGSGYTCTDDGNCNPVGQCEGIACNVAACTGAGQSPTTITGQVLAPNGTLPLYDVTVYVPNDPPGPFTDGVTCGQCTTALPGDPIVQTKTDEDGNFTLPGVPSGTNVPVVITIGKWRRQITVPTISDCTSTVVSATDTTLPKSMSDMTPNTTSVDIPRIAISTGSADALECLIRKLGIADTEIGTAGGAQRIQLYSDLSSAGVGVSKFDSGTAFADSKNLWDTSAHLSVYDIVLLSCEGQQAANTKPQAAMDAMKAYADVGGRVFMSHWHNIWIEGATQAGNGNNGQKPAVWSTIATWTNNDNGGATTDLIDEVSNPKGTSFATWMLNVMGSTVRDQIPISNGRGTVVGLDETKAERWVYTDNGAAQPQNFQFLTPNEDTMNACGKVVFSDMHVSGTISANGGYPSACSPLGTALTPQEKALAFMFFDISSCVGVIQ